MKRFKNFINTKRKEDNVGAFRDSRVGQGQKPFREMAKANDFMLPTRT